MGSFLQRWFGRRPDAANPAPAGPAPIGVAAALEGEALRDEYEEFCATFCFRPRKNLMKYLANNDMERVRDWLHWSTPEPEPKAFVRFAVLATRQGIKIWEQPGLTMYMKGRPPTQESQDCLSILAQVLGKRISLILEGQGDNPATVLRFEP